MRCIRSRLGCHRISPCRNGRRVSHPVLLRTHTQVLRTAVQTNGMLPGPWFALQALGGIRRNEGRLPHAWHTVEVFSRALVCNILSRDATVSSTIMIPSSNTTGLPPPTSSPGPLSCTSVSLVLQRRQGFKLALADASRSPTHLQQHPLTSSRFSSLLSPRPRIVSSDLPTHPRKTLSPPLASLSAVLSRCTAPFHHGR